MQFDRNSRIDGRTLLEQSLAYRPYGEDLIELKVVDVQSTSSQPQQVSMQLLYNLHVCD